MKKKQEMILIGLLADICKVFCFAHTVAAVGIVALIFATGFGDSDWWKLPAALIWCLFIAVELANLHSEYQSKYELITESCRKTKEEKEAAA